MRIELVSGFWVIPRGSWLVTHLEHPVSPVTLTHLNIHIHIHIQCKLRLAPRQLLHLGALSNAVYRFHIAIWQTQLKTI